MNAKANTTFEENSQEIVDGSAITRALDAIEPMTDRATVAFGGSALHIRAIGPFKARMTMATIGIPGRRATESPRYEVDVGAFHRIAETAGAGARVHIDGDVAAIESNDEIYSSARSPSRELPEVLPHPDQSTSVSFDTLDGVCDLIDHHPACGTLRFVMDAAEGELRVEGYDGGVMMESRSRSADVSVSGTAFFDRRYVTEIVKSFPTTTHDAHVVVAPDRPLFVGIDDTVHVQHVLAPREEGGDSA